jgi:hypothetical protein
VPYDLPPPPPDVPALYHQLGISDIPQFSARPGNFTPDFGTVRPGDEWLAYAQRLPMVEPRAEARDRWLAHLPESENVDDRRDQMAIDMDDLRWRKAHGPKKPLKQFPRFPSRERRAGSKRKRMPGSRPRNNQTWPQRRIFYSEVARERNSSGLGYQPYGL